MSHRKIIAIFLVICASCSQPARTQDSRPPESSAAAPSDDDRAYLLRRQQEIFRLTVETDYALALQKLCQTGFGDPRLCHVSEPKPAEIAKAPPPEPPRPRAARSNLNPIVREIAGFDGELSAVLAFGDGRLLTIHAPTAQHPAEFLPGGDRVIAIDAQHVTARRKNGETYSLQLAPGIDEPDMFGGETEP